MDARELRIGNIIQLRHHTMGWSDPQPCEAWMIADAEKYPDSYRFVPLPEDWLVRMGFEKQDGNIGLLPEFKRPNNFYYTLNEYVFKGSTLTIDYGNDHFFDIQNVQNVHQLQNLYFALTGEELEIK